MHRIVWVLVSLFIFLGSVRAESTNINVKKTATCACCQAWVDRLKAAGFKVTTENLFLGSLMKFKLDHGISAKHASCHTGRIAGYTIEGHVPVREINRLLKERPDAVGLSVPGMPFGSPGMEVGTEREAYSVLLIKKDGTFEEFATYSAKP